MIRGPRNSKPVEAVAKRGLEALDESMLEAVYNDRTGIIAMHLPTQVATKTCGTCKATQPIHCAHCHNCGQAFKP